MATYSGTGMSPAGYLRAHLALARISNTPTVVSNVLAGAVLAGPLAFDRRIVFLVLAMALFYTAGMYLNDIFDLRIDTRDRPERPLPSGRVQIRAAWILTITMLGMGLALLGMVSVASFVSGLILVALIAVYDSWHKGNPVGPLLMAGTRVLVYVTAFAGYSTAFSGEMVLWCVVMLAYVAGLTFVAKTESMPRVGRYWPLVAIVLPVGAALVVDATNRGIWLLAVLFVGWMVYSIRFAYRRTNRQVGGAIARLIAGISLVDAFVLVTHEAWWGAAVALSAFAATLFFQRYIRGT